MSFRATILSVLATLALANNVHERGFYEAKFFNWLSEFKVKPLDGEHFVHMLQNFANNEDIIEAHNKGNSTFTLGHNKFSHLSLDEWRQEVRLGLAKPDASEPAAKIHAAPADLSTLPASVDWVSAGAVTGVKDQGQCGSCWSFSTTGSLEGAYYLKTNSLISLSEQNFVDCDNLKNGGKDHACNGGLMDNAFAWAKKNGGVNTEANYPYVSGTTKAAGTCSEKGDKYAAPVSFTDVAVNSDAAMMAALVQQPVSVAIEADQTSFQLYKSGVFSAACGTNLDHGVLAVGYGTLNGADYYNVKNSWGTGWGDKGFIKFARGGSMQKEGQCGILMAASYPNL